MKAAYERERRGTPVTIAAKYNAQPEASQIDAHFDRMAAACLNYQQLMYVESLRDAAHDELRRKILAAVLNA